MGSIPVWGTKFPHAMGQPSLCPTTRESVRCINKRSHMIQCRCCVLQLRPDSARERKKEQKSASKYYQETLDHLDRGVDTQSAYLCLRQEELWGPDWRR